MSILSRNYASLGFLVVSLAAALVAVGCGSDGGDNTVDLGTCPTNSDAQQMAGSNLVTSKCVTCHSSQLSGAARGGAPAGADYDVAATVKAEATEMYGKILDGSMPPGGTLTETEKESIRVYLACLP